MAGTVDVTKFKLTPKGIAMFVIGIIIVGAIIFIIWWGYGQLKEKTGTDTEEGI